MDIKKQFKYDPSIDVSAAQIGISKWDWMYVTEPNFEKAKIIMVDNRFDVLPILNKDNSITSYFSTQEWNNYNNLNKTNIIDSQTVYYRLSLKDLISKFHEDGRHYYFLVDNKEVLGLVSYVNLNCQLVYNSLFYVLSDIERSISKILKSYISEELILKRFLGSRDKGLKEIAERYEAIKKINSDNDIYQHLYLTSIGACLNKFKYELPNEYKKLVEFHPKFDRDGVFNKLRNKVMHPVRPILSDNDSISQMNELLNDYAIIKSITL